VIAELGEAFAQDRLEMAELERRLDLAARARSESELTDLLRGLPERGGTLGSDAEPTGHALSRPVSRAPSRVDPSRVPDRQLNVAFWSGRSRKGSWIPARRITAIALQGGIELDFREALLGAPVTEIHAVAVMGAVDIIVPPGIHVDTSGFAIMGAFEDDGETVEEPERPSLSLRVTGLALMGGVTVSVRLPGETPREARRRSRQERRDRLASDAEDSAQGPRRRRG
jgi:hypothetical protein